MRFSATFLDVESEDGAQVREGGVWLGGGKGGAGTRECEYKQKRK